ncbi:MAG: hypothetical protein ABIR18_04400 [Chitinophagaceae bacterium]
MPKACLIIVFNHRYDKNIPVLEKMYGGRFSAIYFLVPFYNGKQPNVIPVYESSNFFQSFFAQGFSRFFKEAYSHYLFLGDDCILNPSINETNFLEQTGLPDKADFIPGLIEFHKAKTYSWWHTFKGIDFFRNRKGAEIKNELPSREDAVTRFEKNGISVQPLTKENIFGTHTPSSQKWWRYAALKRYYWFNWKPFRKNGKIELPYPIAGAYSDILIITKETLPDFCRYCGIMAAAGLFVEIAIPTALLLSSQSIKQEKDARLKGKALWSAQEIEAVEKKFNKSLSALLKNFPTGELYCHPVKLSKWTNDL